jgi:hypothetical protein
MLIDEEADSVDLYCGYNDIGVVRARLRLAEVLDGLA